MARIVTYTDQYGRRFDVAIPDNAPDSHAHLGARLGPPDLSPLRLPLEVEIELNNQLHARRMITARDIKGRQVDVERAVQRAMRLTGQRVALLYGDSNDE